MSLSEEDSHNSTQGTVLRSATDAEHLEHVPYKPPTEYRFLDQRRRLKPVTRIRKQILFMLALLFLEFSGCIRFLDPRDEELPRATVIVSVIDSLGKPAPYVRVYIGATPTVDSLMAQSKLSDLRGQVIFHGVPTWHPEYKAFWSLPHIPAGYFYYTVSTRYYTLDEKGHRVQAEDWCPNHPITLRDLASDSSRRRTSIA